jgi:AcrR family transcriptional regulator
MTTALNDPAQASSGADAFRSRLLDGLAQSIADRGYRETTVADVVRNAKTSKRTFYDQFASKEECFLELLRANNEHMIATIRGSVDPEAAWDDQVRSAATAYVDHIASQPAITLSWIREAPAMGAVALPLHRLAMDQFADMLVDLTDSQGFRRVGLAPISRPLAVIVIGGLRELTATTVEAEGDVSEILEPAIIAALAILGPGSGRQQAADSPQH